MEPFLFTVFGLVIGSFLNVVILREETGEGVGGRSYCVSCKKKLTARDLVPLVSWIYLRGKCRYCNCSISPQYPLVEAGTALLFLLISLTALPLVLKGLGLVIVSLAIAITVFDMRNMLIPDLWNYLFASSSLIFGLVSFTQNVYYPFDVVAAGFVTALPLWGLWAYSRGAWMGFGDVKFAVGMGWLLGVHDGLLALVGAFVLGAIVSVCVLLPLPFILSYAQRCGILPLSDVSTHFTMKSEVPFGPFLIVSCLTVWLFSHYGLELLRLW